MYNRSQSNKSDSYYRIPSQVAIPSKSQSLQFSLPQSSDVDPYRQHYSVPDNTNTKPSPNISHQYQPHIRLNNTIPTSNTTPTPLSYHQDNNANIRIKSLANIMMENKEKRRLSGEAILHLNK